MTALSDAPGPRGPRETIDSTEARDALLDRLASMVPGGDLAVVLEDVVRHLLVAVEPGECGADGRGPDGSNDADPAVLLPDLLDPAERALVDAADAWWLDGSATGGAGVVAALGAEVVSELVAAASRLKSWAGWAEAVLAGLLVRTTDMSGRAHVWSEAAARPDHDERLFNATGHLACRLGVSRTRATRVVERGEALLAGPLSRTESLHRAGLLDEAKTALIARRLECVDPEVTIAVQERVLARAPHRTHAQLAKDVDRALAALDPDGAAARRRRDVAGRHVSRPRPAGAGVSLVRLLLPTPDAFLLDATLDAVAASARAAGDERSLGQLRADALVSMSLTTLRGSQAAAFSAAAGRGSTGVLSAGTAAAGTPTGSPRLPGRMEAAGSVPRMAPPRAPSSGRMVPVQAPVGGCCCPMVCRWRGCWPRSVPWWAPPAHGGCPRATTPFTRRPGSASRSMSPCPWTS